MAIPSYDKFIEPILRFLGGHPEGTLAKDAHERAADVLGLSDVDKAELLPSGRQQVYKNRAGWAHDRLKRAGLSSSPRKGLWQITQQGQVFLEQNPGPLSAEQLLKLTLARVNVRLRSTAQTNPDAGALTSSGPGGIVRLPTTPSDPTERLEEALEELRESVANEVLEAIGQSSPKFFETLVLDLLHEMGYGTDRSDLKRVGGSGDGGIDGVISLDRLGLEKVYVQAKRWKQSVGRPEVQAFYGALAGQHANKGVFITTSSFTTQAIEFADSIERIVLVDGQRLADLMIEHAVGVSHRPMILPKLDSDYFEE